MLHDIGQIILMGLRPESAGERIQPGTFQNIRTGRTILQAERRIAGEDHAQIGARFIDEWRLDPMLADAVRFHHAGLDEVRDSFPLVKIVYVADRHAHCLAQSVSLQAEEVCEESSYLVAEFFDLSADTLDELTDIYRDQFSETASIMGIEVETPDVSEAVESVRSSEQEEMRLLHRHAFDHAMITGLVEDMASAGDPDVLFGVFARSISLLFDPDALLVARLNGGQALRGEVAAGMRHAERAHLVHLKVREKSIWKAAFRLRRPIHYDEFFNGVSPSASDRQMVSFMEGPFLAVPLTACKKRYGILVMAMTYERWKSLEEYVDILMLLVRQFTMVSTSFYYRKLWNREQKLNAVVLRVVPVSIVLVSHAGEISYLNPTASEVLGLDMHSVPSGLDIWKILHLDRDAVDAFLQEIETHGRAQMPPFSFENDSGRIWLSLRGIRLENVGLSRIMLVLEDITDRYLLDEERRKRTLILESELKRRTEELEKARERVIQAERLKGIGTFARQVAHEVNNPLGIIKNFLRVLRHENIDDKDGEETVDLIESEIDRISETISHLHHFARYGTPDSMEKMRGPCYVGAAVDGIKKMLVTTLADSDIELSFTLSDHIPAVSMSEDAIKQVIINLVKNAREAIEPPGKIDVDIFTQQENDTVNVVIEVRDTGRGVAPEIADSLFEPFVTTKGAGNSGLGLSVCYGLIKAAGGMLHVESMEGRGAVFRVILPVHESAGVK